MRRQARSGRGTTCGIYTYFERVVVRNNDVQGNGVGVRCFNTQATARDNVIAGFAIGVDGCLSSNNTVNTN